jgi:hypothetical protein
MRLLLEIVLQGEVLSDQDGLAIFLDHMKVIGGVHSPLKQDPVQRREFHLGRGERRRYPRVYCILEEFCDEVCGALEGD